MNKDKEASVEKALQELIAAANAVRPQIIAPNMPTWVRFIEALDAYEAEGGLS